MSLYSLLNSSAPSNNHPPPAKVHRVRVSGAVEPRPAPVQVKAQPTPLPAPTTNNSQKEGFLVFSILAKIILPKKIVEKIAVNFNKLLNNKISFQTVAKFITDSINGYETVQCAWSVITDRKHPTNNRLYLKVKEIVAWFQYNDIQENVLYEFMSFLTEAKKNNQPKIYFISRFLTQKRPYNMPQLLNFALALYPMLPRNKRPNILYNMKTHSDLDDDIFNSSIPFSVPKRYHDLAFVLKKRRKNSSALLKAQKPPVVTEPKPQIKYTPSHLHNEIPLSVGAPNLLFNFITKSIPVGHEGGNPSCKTHHSEAAPTPTRDLHELFETMEVKEHLINGILGLTVHLNRVNHIFQNSLDFLYGYDSVFFEKLLKNTNVREFIIDKCRKKLPAVCNEHYNTIRFCRNYMETQPTNAFLRSIQPPKFTETYSFHFDYYETNVSYFIKTIIIHHLSQRHPNINWFIENVIPIFQYDTTEKQYLIYGPRTLACSLWYFSMICTEIAPLFSPDSTDFETWDSISDAAFDQIALKYQLSLKLPHKQLSRMLKSIISNRTITDPNADVCAQHFGKLTQNIAHFYPIFDHLNKSCSWLASDPHITKLLELARLFGSKDTNTDESTFDSRQKLYLNSIPLFSNYRLFSFRFDFDTNMMIVSPVNNIDNI